MSDSTKKWSWFCVSGIIGACVYCILTLISASYYPDSFGPFTDYLSVLGNSTLNPNGAIFYNLGVALTGLSLVPFYIGMYMLFREPSGSKLISIATFFGFLNVLSIVLSAVFPEDVYELHFIWSLMIFLTWIPVLFLTNVSLFRTSGFTKWISLYGLGLALFDTGFVVNVVLLGTSTGSINEWITIFAFLGWIIMLALAAIRRQSWQSG